MQKQLEDFLMERIGYSDKSGFYHKRFPRDVIQEMLDKCMIKSPKQAWATLNKWIAKGIYNYGCAKDMGWIEIPNHEKKSGN